MNIKEEVVNLLDTEVFEIENDGYGITSQYHSCVRESRNLSYFDGKGDRRTIKHPEYKNKGVYFLYDNEELVYIGMSINILNRVNSHVREKKMTFNKIKIVHTNFMDKKGIFDLESKLINKHNPRYNFTTQYDSSRDWCKSLEFSI